MGSKVTAILLKGWIWPIGGVASRRVCACSLRSRLVFWGRAVCLLDLIGSQYIRQNLCLYGIPNSDQLQPDLSSSKKSRLGVQEYKSTRVQAYKSTRVQEYKSIRVQEYKSTRLQEYKITRVQEYKSTRVQILPIIPILPILPILAILPILPIWPIIPILTILPILPILPKKPTAPPLSLTDVVFSCPEQL